MKDERELRSGVRCILFVGLLSVIEVLISLYLNRHSNVEYTSQFAIIDMLLYLWIVYLGYGWTIGYEKIFAHGIWFFKEENVIFGGRLGNYKYYDMDKVILSALERAKKAGL